MTLLPLRSHPKYFTPPLHTVLLLLKPLSFDNSHPLNVPFSPSPPLLPIMLKPPSGLGGTQLDIIKKYPLTPTISISSPAN